MRRKAATNPYEALAAWVEELNAVLAKNPLAVKAAPTPKRRRRVRKARPKKPK